MWRAVLHFSHTPCERLNFSVKIQHPKVLFNVFMHLKQFSDLPFLASGDTLLTVANHLDSRSVDSTCICAVFWGRPGAHIARCPQFLCRETRTFLKGNHLSTEIYQSGLCGSGTKETTPWQKGTWWHACSLHSELLRLGEVKSCGVMRQILNSVVSVSRVQDLNLVKIIPFLEGSDN